jgi:hypothetical protein
MGHTTSFLLQIKKGFLVSRQKTKFGNTDFQSPKPKTRETKQKIASIDRELQEGSAIKAKAERDRNEMRSESEKQKVAEVVFSNLMSATNF